MSVDRTENKNDRKGLAQVGYCLKYLMNFLRPYKGGLVLGLLMVVVANITFAIALFSMEYFLWNTGYYIA